MDTGTAIMIGSFMSLIGMIIIVELSHSNWFKKENFKIQRDVVKAENKLKLKKLERELGLSGKNSGLASSNVSENSPTNLLTSLAPLLSKLDGDQIMDLADRFLPEGAEGAEPSGITGTLLQYAQENPEMVQKILGSLTNKLGGENINKPAEY